MPDDAKHLIILVHGIRDPGFWQDILKAHFQSRKQTVVVNAKTDVVDLFRFISPRQSMRDKPVNRVKAVIENAVAAHKGAKITIIAHSFGTWMVSKILHEDTKILVDRLILCGSIVPDGFRWDRLMKINLSRLARRRTKPIVAPILNEYSPLDVWPLAAKVASYGYGNTGSRGIGDGGAGVIDRRHSIPHSGYLDTAFAKKFWDPLIFENRIVSSDPKPVKQPWYFVLTRIPVNYMTMALSVVFLGLMVAGYFGIHHRRNLEIVALAYKEGREQAAGRTEIRIPVFRVDAEVADGGKIQPIFVNNDTSPDANDDLSLAAYSLAAARNVTIQISNRAPIRCKNEETGEWVGNSTPWAENKSIYLISFEPSPWWRNLLALNWGGTVRVKLRYDPAIGENGVDRLSLVWATGLRQGSVTINPKHSPDSCFDGDRAREMYDIRPEFANVGPSEDGWLRRLFRISFASAAEKAQSRIKELLGSSDVATRGIAIESIRQDAPTYKDSYSDLLADDSPATQISDVLSGLAISANPMASLSLATRERVFALSWDEDSQKRVAARSFLRAKNVATAELAGAFRAGIDAKRPSIEKAFVGPFPDPRQEKLYLALIALRDIYYNAALFRFDQGESEGGKAIDAAIDDAVAIFKQCGGLRDMANLDLHYQFAKCDYGIALVRYRLARIKYAMEKSEAKDPSPAAILRDLTRFKADNVTLPLKEHGAGDAFLAFDAFLKSVEGNEPNYPWPHHITQARACTAGKDYLPFACLESE